MAIGTILVLLVPLCAMQFSEEVDWSGFDFIVMGLLIYASGSCYVLICRKFTEARKLVVGIIIFLIFLFIWAELSVGISTNIGS